LALLRRDGIVAARRDAQTIFYAISSPAAQRILQTLYDVYCAPRKTPAPGKPPRKSAAQAAKTQPARRRTLA
jgi:hypothetical protein